MTHKLIARPRRLAELVVVLMLTAACNRHSSLFMTVAPDPKPRGPMIAVLKSDVLVIDNRAVRLADAVTPQAAPDAHCTAEALAARQTELRLKDLAQRALTASATPTGERDADGRPYAHIQLDGADPARKLIAEGLAVRPGKTAFSWCGPIAGDGPRAARIAALSRASPGETRPAPPTQIPR
jgi:endonuclease YncB( thermonuclease family)